MGIIKMINYFDFVMNISRLIALIVFLFVLSVIIRVIFMHVWKKKRAEVLSKNLRFLNVRMPRHDSASDKEWDTIQSLKQNIEIMNQIYKNVYSVSQKSLSANRFGQQYVGCELFVEKELISFNMAVPLEFTETFEKLISSFYPWAVIDIISPPKLLESGKFVDWGYIELKKDDVYPLKTYENFEADPMDGILSAFARVESDEKLVLQILAQPLTEKRQKNIRHKVEAIKEWKSSWWLFSNIIPSDKKDEEKQKSASKEHSQQQLSDIEKKAEDEWFNIVMRVFASSPIEHRPDKIVDDLLRWLFQYNYVWCNSFNYIHANNLKQFARDIVKRTFVKPYLIGNSWWWKPASDVLNIKELSSVFHFPHVKYNKNPRIRRQKFKIVPAPDNIPTEWLHLGTNLYGWVKRDIYLWDMDRFRHFYIIWQTGTGKSVTLKSMVMQDMVVWWPWFTLIDPHGDLCEDSLAYFPKERIDDLIYRDAWNMELPVWFNFLTARDEREMDLVTNDAVDMFVQLYGPEIFGPRIQDYFRNAVLTLMEQPDGGTLVEIVRLFTDEAYQKIKIKNVKNPVVRGRRDKTYNSMWDREKKEMIPYFQAKFGSFTTTPILRNIIWQPESSFDIGEAMDSGKILMMNLSKGKMWDINADLLGMMIVSQVRLAAFRRANLPEDERVPHFLYIDEFQNFVTPSIESILSEARKYRLWLILAHQYLDQLKPQWWKIDLEAPILWNVWNMMSLRIWVKDTETLEHQFKPNFSWTDLTNLDKFMAVTKLSINMQPTPAFSMKVKLPRETPPLNTSEKVQIIKQISALKYGRKKELVDKEIFYRVGA